MSPEEVVTRFHEHLAGAPMRDEEELILTWYVLGWTEAPPADLLGMFGETRELFEAFAQGGIPEIVKRGLALDLGRIVERQSDRPDREFRRAMTIALAREERIHVFARLVQLHGESAALLSYHSELLRQEETARRSSHSRRPSLAALPRPKAGAATAASKPSAAPRRVARAAPAFETLLDTPSDRVA